jgi:hypothetical protein
VSKQRNIIITTLCLAVLAVLLFVASGGWFRGEGEVAPVLPDGLGVASDPIRAPVPTDEASLSAPARMTASPAHGMRGRVSWADGLPAVGVVVAQVGSPSLESEPADEDGVVWIPWTPSTARTEVSVRAPCWSSAVVMPVEVTSDDAGNSCLAALQLPAEGDAVVTFAVAPELAVVLERNGFSRLRVDWRLPPAPGAFPLPKIVRTDSHAIGSPVEATVRLPFASDYRCMVRATVEDSVSGCALATRTVEVTRDRVARCALAADASHMLTGRVQGHDGVAIPRAFVEVRIADPEVPGRFSRSPRDLSVDGEFVYFGDPTRSHSICCRYEGVERLFENVTLGSDVVLELDLSTLKRFVFCRNGVPIERFRVGSAFALPGPPPVLDRPGGVGWIHPKAPKFRRDIVLSWVDGGAIYEIVVPRPDADSPDPYRIDAAHHDLRPAGELIVRWNGVRDTQLTIRRVQPPPPSVGSPYWSQLLARGPDQHLFGIVAGRYVVEAQQRRGSEGMFTREMEIDVVEHVVEIDVAALLAR